MKWRVSPYFSIHIHIKDIDWLKLIQNSLGVGKVRKNSENTAVFRVDKLQEIQVIIYHFKKYPLVSAKHSDFLLFEAAYNLIKQKEHLTVAGLEKVLALRFNLNKGLPVDLKFAFPNVVPVVRPEYKFNGIPDPFWVSGFVSGDSTFCVSIEKSNNKLGKRVRLIFGTCLHIRDKHLLIGMADYFKNLNFNVNNSSLCLRPRPWGQASLITSASSLQLQAEANTKDISVHCSENNDKALLQFKNKFDIENKVVPFFKLYPVLGVKRLDF